MLIKLKLPERKPKHHLCAATYGEGFNDALDEIQSLNPEMEIDLNALEKEILSSDLRHAALNYCSQKGMVGKSAKMTRELVEHLIANAPRWLKEKD